jgi:hypothetical protein
VLGFSRGVVAVEGESRVTRLSLRYIRSWRCSMLLAVMSVCSRFQWVEQNIPKWAADVTVQRVTFALPIAS